MAETSINGDSPKAVALRLLEFIAVAEKKALGMPESTADKAWILNTYGECLRVVQGKGVRSQPTKISSDVLDRS
jgi:hypothetical protein